MRKLTFIVMALAMVLGFTQCKKDQLEPQDLGEKVNITLNVNSSNNSSRAVVTPPSVAFETGDQILVASNGHYVGTLTHNGTNFNGDITDPVVGEPLYFYFLGNKATGTLTPGTSGSTSCTVNISDQTNYPHLPVISMGVSIDRSNHNAIVEYTSGVTSYEAQLHNKASLIKFNVTTSSTSSIYLTGMYNTVTVNFADLTTNDGFSYSNAGYIKMKAKDAENVTWAIVLPQADLTGAGEAYTIGYSGTWDKTAVDLAAANQYITGDGSGISLTVNTEGSRILDLSTVNSNKTVEDGWIVTNALSGKYKISIAAGATVTLDGATITYASNGADYAGLTCVGDATIILADGTTNTIVGGLDGDGNSNWPGIFVPAGSTLTINGNTGVLNARRGGDDVDNGSPAGIGAAWRSNAGNIVINGGVINAEGGAKAAGIGGTCWRACGDITINGGTITATGHKWGTGIGLGGTENANSFTSLSGGDITITGGTVIATGGEKGAGIGTGTAEHQSGKNMTITLGNILISGGTVTATGGQYGAGIGTGHSEGDNRNNCGTITITGGIVTATGGEKAPGIGCGHKNQGNYNSECGAITISGGTVTATGGAQAAGIGCGYHDVNGNTGDLKCGDITITSGVTSVTATKGDEAHNCIGVNKVTNQTTCTRVTIGGTLYWGPAGATYYYANGGDTYLTTSPLVYPAP